MYVVKPACDSDLDLSIQLYLVFAADEAAFGYLDVSAFRFSMKLPGLSVTVLNFEAPIYVLQPMYNAFSVVD